MFYVDYKAILISTIVDTSLLNRLIIGYKAILISTIVDGLVVIKG